MKLDGLDPARKQRFKNLLLQLQDMGFLDFERNLRTAERIGSEINHVMEELAKPEMPMMNQGLGMGMGYGQPYPQQ